MNTYELCEFSEVTENIHMIKKSRVNPILDNEKWKLPIIEEISLIKFGFLTTDMELQVLEDILESVATE